MFVCILGIPDSCLYCIGALKDASDVDIAEGEGIRVDAPELMVCES